VAGSATRKRPCSKASPAPEADIAVRTGARADQRSRLTGKRKEQLQKYREKMRAQAIIEWKNDDIKRAYEEGLKQLAIAPA
jgi:3'-phosphoadenosine 5'-phosphosulfate sulfotransferase (PAPS reductase)/FAD synthetase